VVGVHRALMALHQVWWACCDCPVGVPGVVGRHIISVRKSTVSVVQKTLVTATVKIIRLLDDITPPMSSFLSLSHHLSLEESGTPSTVTLMTTKTIKLRKYFV
jgi:hypothetical protein